MQTPREKGPARFFTANEKRFWRAAVKCNDGDDHDDWFALPGPAEWWGSDEEIDQAGFYIPAGDAKPFRRALKVIMEGKLTKKSRIHFIDDPELRIFSR